MKAKLWAQQAALIAILGGVYLAFFGCTDHGREIRAVARDQGAEPRLK